MPKPFRVLSTRPLPADAVIVQHEGEPHVRMLRSAADPCYTD